MSQGESPETGDAALGRRRACYRPGRPPQRPILWLARIVDWSIVLIGATMATLVFANVIVHNLFHGDIAWTTEFCELLMVWVTFLGGAAATRRGAHMVVGELVNRLPGGPGDLRTPPSRSSCW